MTLLLFACNGQAEIRGDPQGIASIVDKLDGIRSEAGVAAFGIALVDTRGIIHTEVRGLADRQQNEEIAADALFRIGSITKMFTGLTALKLAASSDFSLSAPVASFPTSSYYQNPWQQSRPLTTAMLLEHSAGFTDLAQAEWDFSDPRSLPLAETLRLYPEARRVRWPPGVHSSYSNAGAGLAGRVMELAADRSYEALLQTLVLDPMGMTATSVLPPASGLPVGYDRDGITPIPYWHQIFRPFAAINSSLDDMGRFVVMLLNRGQLEGKTIYPAAMIERLETPRTTLAARSGLEFGYGLGNYAWLRNGILFHGHGGDADGYLSRLAYTRANGSGYFLVITAFQGRTLRQMQRALEEYMVAEVEAETRPVTVVLTPREIDQRVGRYEQLTQRFAGGRRSTLQITDEQGMLFTSFADGTRQRLLPVKPLHLRRPQQIRATIFLGPDENGRMTYQGDEGNFGKVEATR